MNSGSPNVSENARSGFADETKGEVLPDDNEAQSETSPEPTNPESPGSGAVEGSNGDEADSAEEADQTSDQSDSEEQS